MGGSSSILQNSKADPLIKHSIHQTNQYIHRVVRCYQCNLPNNDAEPTLNTSQSPMNSRLKEKIRSFRNQGMDDYEILYWLQKAYGKHLVCTRKVAKA